MGQRREATGIAVVITAGADAALWVRRLRLLWRAIRRGVLRRALCLPRPMPTTNAIKCSALLHRMACAGVRSGSATDVLPNATLMRAISNSAHEWHLRSYSCGNTANGCL